MTWSSTWRFGSRVFIEREYNVNRRCDFLGLPIE
jgi:hypothetical protein